MYTLYHGAGTCSLAVKAALALTGADFNTQALDMASGEHLSAEYQRISPLNKVPALAFDLQQQAEVLTEGSAILLYLSSEYPDAELMPKTGTVAYASALKWLQLLYSTVHPHWGRLFFPERYGNDPDSIRSAAEAELHKLYSIIETQLSEQPYIAGKQLSLADLYLMVSLHWEMALQQDLSSQYPNLHAYRQRMYQESTIGDLYRAEFNA
mgnify:CR=1 FL=1